MDFHTLPRRDLQALCKRNGVRANMTNVAMADALRALPKVDGIEEYVKQPVPVPEPEVTTVVEEQREATLDDAPALGAGRRGACRRARPAPSVAALASKMAAEEEQRAPIPRGCRGKDKGSSTEPIRLDDSDDEEKENSKPQVEQEDAQLLGVGRRGGASRRAQVAPALAVPEAKAEEKQRAPVPRGRRVGGKSTELIRLDDNKEEKKEDTKSEEDKGDAPAIAVGRRGASRRAPAHSEAPAMRRSAAASKAQAGDVGVEDVPIRPTRQPKPTMKAAAAAEEKAPRRAKRRCAVMSTLLQQEVQEEPQEAVGAPDVVVEAVPIRATRQRKPTIKVAAAAARAEEKAPPRAARRGAVMRTVLQLEVEEEPQAAVGAPISYQRYDALEELKEASDPQKQVLNDDEDEDVVINEDENLMEETPAEEPSVTDHECKDKSEMQEQQVDDEKYYASLATQEESPILGFVSMVTEQASEDDESANFQHGGGFSSGLLDKGVCEDTCDAGEEKELVCGVVALQAPLAANESEANHESEIGSVREEISEADTKDDEVCKEKEHMDIDELQAGIVDEAPFLDCSDNISQVAREETYEEVNTEVGLSCQEEGGVVVDRVLHDSVENTILLDCSSDISWVEVEKAGNITSEMPEAALDEDGDEPNAVVIGDPEAALDEDGDKPNAVVIGDSMSQATMTDEIVQEEKGVLITDEIPQGTAGMHDMEDDQFEIAFVHADHVVTADNLLEQVTNGKITAEVNTSLIVDERQQSTVTMDEDVFEDHSETDGAHSSEQIEAVITDGVSELKLIKDVLVQADQVVTARHLPEQVTNSEITVEEKTVMIVDEKQQSIVTMDEYADEQMEVEVPELTGTNVGIIEKKLGVDEKQNITVTMDTDVVDNHSKTDVHADEQMGVATTEEVPELTDTDDEVVEEMKTPLVVDEKQQSTVTNNGDILDDHFKTHGAHADEQKEVVATEVPEVTGTDGEIEEKTPLIVDEKKQSTITMDGDVVFDHLKTDTVHADEQKEVIGIVTEVPDEVTGTDDEVVEEKAVAITEDMSNQGTVANITRTMNECLKENEQKKASTADIEPEASRAQEGDARKEIALLDDVTESLSKSIITMEPSVCKNSSEKNSAEPMSVLLEKGVKVASKSEDLTKLSLGQLRAKLKEKLKAKKKKEAKRVALARVDENVCRSHAKGPQQNLNLQQH